MNINSYTTVDRLLSKFHREIKSEELSENDIIEWIGEAMDYLKMPELQEEAVAFIKVENYQSVVPKHFHLPIQLLKYERDIEKIKNCEKPENINSIEELTVKDIECCDNVLLDYLMGNLDAVKIPYFDMQWQYIKWESSYSQTNNFSIIRAANDNFFNGLICEDGKQVYNVPVCNEEYSIIGTAEKQIRFSFEEGYVALAYVRNAIDKETGYPLIPDNTRHINAISYYVRWKIAEMKCWNGRANFCNIAQDEERKWNKYIGQAKSYSKMPKTIDDYQDFMDESYHLLPKRNRYNSRFGNLGRK